MNTLTKEKLDVIIRAHLATKIEERRLALNSPEYKVVEKAEFARLWEQGDETDLLQTKHRCAQKAAHAMGYDSHREVTKNEEFKWTRDVLEKYPDYVHSAYLNDTLWTPEVQKRWSVEGHSL